MFYIFFTQLANVHQPVLVHADIHKGTEVHHVADGAGQFHAGLQVLHFQHIAAQHRRRQRFARVSPRLLQLGDDIPHCRHAGAQLLRQGLIAHFLRQRRQLLHPLGADLLQRTAAQRQQPFGGRVAFGVDGGGVQRIFTAGDPQKAGALLVGLFAQLGHLQQLAAGGKAAVFLPVSHNVPGDGAVDARDMLQQRGRRGIKVNAHRVDAAFHHAVQGGIQPGGRHIVLVLPDADGLGVDLHQLRQRVLQAAGNGDRAAQVDVILRELLAGEPGRGVDRSPRFADDGILHRQPAFGNQFRHDFFRFPAGGAVADGNDRHPVLFQQGGHQPLGLGDPVVGLGGVHHGGIQHPSGGVHHRQLAAVAVAGVPPQHHLTGERWLHQQVMQIFGKDPDGLFRGRLKQLTEGLVFHAGGDQALPAIGTGGSHRPPAGVLGGDRLFPDHLQRLFLLQHNGGFQQSFLLAAVDGQDAVRGNAADRLPEVVVHFICSVLFVVAGGGHYGGPPDQQAQRLADLAVIGNILREDIHGARQGVLRRFHARFCIQIVLRHGQRLPQGVLRADGRCQRLQPLFPRDAAAGTAAGLVGTVEVLHFRQRPGRLHRRLQLRGQLLLLLHGAQHLLPALLQAAQVRQPVRQVAQGGVIQTVGHLLAVAGDKGDGVSLIQQADRRFHLVGTELQLLRKLLQQFHRSVSFLGR